MATSNNKDSQFLTMQILGTPPGRQVLQVFISELFTTVDILRSADRAKQEAERNGTLLPFQIALVVDFLTKVLGPLLIDALRKSKK